MPNPKYTFDVYKFLKLLTGIANIITVKHLLGHSYNFKLGNGMLPARFSYPLLLVFVPI